jgi:hypothetical protein
MPKHPLHIAFETWETSEEGKACKDAQSIQTPDSQQVYLSNRLNRAFYAGAAAQYEIDRHPDKFRNAVIRILGYEGRSSEQKIAELKKLIQ